MSERSLQSKTAVVTSHPDSGEDAPIDSALVETLRAGGQGRLVFTRFRLISEIGCGGMAVVWLAKDERLDLEVALKFLPGLVVKDASALEELRREIKRGLVLSHPGVVRVYDLHEDAAENMAAIAMEYVSGLSLAQEKTRQPDRCFDAAALAPWVHQLCDVLTYVHEEGKIVHRDIKPQNLMLTAAGKLKVTDFGIAAVISEGHSRLTQAVGSGTPAYMSPQQADGELPCLADDVYAIGATLYDLLTSKPPFFRGRVQTVLHQVRSALPPAMMDRRSEFGIAGRAPIPAAWQETIAACLEKEPSLRPKSVQEIAERLGLGKPRAIQPVRNKPIPRWAFPAVAAAAVILLLGWIVRSQSPPAQEYARASEPHVNGAGPAPAGVGVPSAHAPESLETIAGEDVTPQAGHPTALKVSTNKTTYRNGENVICSVEIPSDGYLRLYSIDASGERVRIFPNAFEPNDRVHAGQIVKVPSNEAYDLRLELPPGMANGTEFVQAVFSAQPFADEPPSNDRSAPYRDLGPGSAAELKTRGLTPRQKAFSGQASYQISP